MSTALIIGAGRIARLRLSCLADHEGVSRRVLASRDPRRAADLSSQGIEVIDLAAAAELRPAMAFVSSATRNHGEDLELALGLGCPLLCEKPLSDSGTLAAEAVAQAQRHSVPMFVGFQRRFDPAMRALAEQISGGSLGTLYHLRFTHFDHLPESREALAGSGGIFRDLAIHDIECAGWLTGQPVRSALAIAQVRQWSQYREVGDHDTATVLLTMADRLTVTINASAHQPLGRDVRVEAIGSAGALSVGLGASTPLQALEGEHGFAGPLSGSFLEDSRAAIRAETLAFADFATDRSPQFEGTTAAAALEAQRVAQACERSCMLGNAPVEIGECVGV